MSHLYLVLKSLIISMLLVLTFITNVHAEYTEEPNSPENLIEILKNDFNTEWVNEENLISVHTDDMYLMGVLSDYAIVKEIVNNSIGTNFPGRSNKRGKINVF